MSKSAKPSPNVKGKTPRRSTARNTATPAVASPPAGSRGGAGNHAAPVRSNTKLAQLIELLRRKNGATITQMAEATGWQPHSVRGAISGTLKKKHGLLVTAEKIEGRGRVYRIAPAKQ